MYAAMMTVLLAVGAQCPACQGQAGQAVDSRPGYHAGARPIVYQHRLWCRPGQQCLSCTQPIAPGYGTYNYRNLFNYPWSMGPELGAGYAGYGYGCSCAGGNVDEQPEVLQPVEMEAKRIVRLKK